MRSTTIGPTGSEENWAALELCCEEVSAEEDAAEDVAEDVVSEEDAAELCSEVASCEETASEEVVTGAEELVAAGVEEMAFEEDGVGLPPQEANNAMAEKSKRKEGRFMGTLCLSFL